MLFEECNHLLFTFIKIKQISNWRWLLGTRFGRGLQPGILLKKYGAFGECPAFCLGKQLHEESLFKIYTVMTNMKNLIADGELDIGVQAFSRLAGKIMDATSIPFHGEPLAGLQIMGVLETRNLDFKNILMLSVNEGMMPKTPADISFIPYNLRRAFGLQTKENRNAIYAYYFYRLLQRAKDITLMYNASVSGLNKKEMSRFMLQLQAESGLDIAKYHIDSDMHLPGTRTWEVRKDNAIMEKLHSFSHLYASSINTYIDCGVKFYLTYILGIKERKDTAADIDNAMFGTLFHRSMELLYDKLRERDNIIRQEDMETLLKNKPITFQELCFVCKPITDSHFYIIWVNN